MIIVMHKGWWQFFFIIISLLFLWSVFLRFFQFGKVPVGLYWDETAILLDARSVAETGLDIHSRPWYQVIYPSYGDYKLPVYIWLAAMSVRILGANEAALRLPSAVAGLLTIGISGWLVKVLLETDESAELATLAGFLTALTVALAPWSILFSRTGFEAHLAQSLLAISILCFVLGRKRPWLIYLSPLFGLAATYTYFSVRYVWLGAFLILTLLYFLPSLNDLKYSTKKVLLSFSMKVGLPLLIFVVGLWPMLHSPLYDASNAFRLSTDSVLQNGNDVLQSNVYRGLAGNSRIDRVVFYRWWLTGKKLLHNYSDNVSLSFLFINGDPNLRHGTTQNGLFLLFFLPFFAIGWYVLFRRYPKVFILFLGWWLLALLPASVPNTTPHALRSLNALVPLSGVIGIGLALSILKISQRLNNLQVRPSKMLIKSAAILGISGVLIINLIQFSFFYFEEYPSLSANAWQGGFKQLAETTFAQRKNNQPVYVLAFDDRFYLWLLLYGPYSAQQIQSFPHDHYQIRDFDNIYTEHIPSTLSESALIVGQPDQVKVFIDQSQYQLIDSHFVMNSSHTQFEVAQVELKQKNEK